MPKVARQWIILVILTVLFLATQGGLAHYGDGGQWSLARRIALGEDGAAGTITGAVEASEAPATNPSDTAAATAAPSASSPSQPIPVVERPGVAILTVPFVWLGSMAQSALPVEPERFYSGIGAQITVAFAAVALALAGVLIFRIALELGCRPQAAEGAVLAFAISTLALPYAGRLSEAVLAAPVVLVILWGWLRLRSGYETRADLLALGAGLGLAPLAHDLTLLLYPLFLLLVMLHVKHLLRPRWRLWLVFGPAVLGLIAFASYNNHAFGGPLNGPNGDVVQGLIARYTAASPLADWRAALVSTGSWRAMLAAWAWPANPVFTPRAPGLFAAMPVLALSIFGVMNLRYEPNTRRPLYAILLVIALWTVAALGARDVLSPVDHDMVILLPVVALLCVLIASFVEYHLMTLAAVIIKPALWLAFVYLTMLGAANMITTVMLRTAARPEAQQLMDVYSRAPRAIPRSIDVKDLLALALPGAPNLPLTLPIALAFAALPFVIGFALREKGLVRMGPSPTELRRVRAVQAARGPVSDTELYESRLGPSPTAALSREQKSGTPRGDSPPSAGVHVSPDASLDWRALYGDDAKTHAESGAEKSNDETEKPDSSS